MSDLCCVREDDVVGVSVAFLLAGGVGHGSGLSEATSCLLGCCRLVTELGDTVSWP